MDFDTPIRAIEDAKRYFKAMGCSHFHMAREYPVRNSEYFALRVSSASEVEWTREEISSAVDQLLSTATDRTELWSIHSELSDLVARDGFEPYLERLLAATSEIEPRLPLFDRLLVAETIVGRQKLEYRSGLIFKCQDTSKHDLAAAFYLLARELSDKPFRSQEHEQRRQTLLASLAATATCCEIPTNEQG